VDSASNPRPRGLGSIGPTPPVCSLGLAPKTFIPVDHGRRCRGRRSVLWRYRKTFSSETGRWRGIGSIRLLAPIEARTD
jgi:hypothetical protein